MQLLLLFVFQCVISKWLKIVRNIEINLYSPTTWNNLSDHGMRVRKETRSWKDNGAQFPDPNS